MGTRQPVKGDFYHGAGAARARRRPRAWVVALAALGLAAGGALLYLQQQGLHPLGQAASLMAPPFGGKERVSILVLGVDSDREPRRSDTMLVATIDVPGRKVSVISLPRDLRAEIPGHGTQKINSAYTLGGVDLARQTVEQALGITTDYYVRITVSGLVKVVDAMGGVEIDVEKRMRYRDRSQKLFINLQPGVQRLNGEQAMHYVRFRHDALGDISRIGRQQKFLKAVAEQAVKGENLVRLPRLAGLFVKAVETDMRIGDLRALGRLAQEQGAATVRCATVPGAPATVGGISYLEPDWRAARRMVDDVLMGRPPVVEVVDGGGNTAAALEVARKLEQEGCEVTHVAEGEERSATTQLIDHFGRPDRAPELAQLVKARVVQAGDGGEIDFTVVVGADYVASTNQARHGS